MSQDLNQFNKFLSEDNFHLALKRLQTASRDIYKNLYYQDLKIFSLFAEENINTLLNEIEQKIYEPECSYRIFVPKKNGLVRPLSLLKFKDLLVYQAIVNTISDIVVDHISPYHSNFVFGSCYNTSNAPEQERIFFLKKWTDQWKAFESKTKHHYETGYCYLAEFDIASFFDTIDHFILAQVLNKKYLVEEPLLEFLSTLLASWTGDFTGKTLNGKHGIPQGPIASQVLSDLYLFYLDLEMLETQSIDIKYIRYVDDIRVFSKTENSAKKAIAYLDLLARDLGLIPQGGKILINKIDDINTLLRHQKSKFSQIKKEYQKSNRLKSKTHKKLKERFLNCFIEDSEEVYLDKTLIKFSLYKLNEDEEIKNSIIFNWSNLQLNHEAVLFYLSKHFYSDSQVRSFLKKILADENLLFQHTAALIFSFFPDIEYMSSLYKKYIVNNNRHWFVQYHMIKWLRSNKKGDMIRQLETDNYFIAREMNAFIYSESEDRDFKKFFCENLICSQDNMLALQGVYLDVTVPFGDNLETEKINKYVLGIINSDLQENYINHTLKDKYRVLNSSNFFNKRIWSCEKTYSELNFSFRIFHTSSTSDASRSLMSLNVFNHLIFDKICELLEIKKPHKDYGANLDSGCIKEEFPIVNQYFKDINSERNQRTDAHPYDKYGNLRIRVNVKEMEMFIEKQIKALKEICKREYS
jgi:hypothetical protein